jgi:hypothetical protein
MATEPTIAVLNGASKAQENRDVAQGLTATADIFAKRFEKEMKAGRLTRTPSAPDSWQANLTHFSAGMRLDECQIANTFTDNWSR